MGTGTGIFLHPLYGVGFPSFVGANLAGCLKTSGEHKVHPYVRPETLCRGESCIRPTSTFDHFFGF